ncbi:MAG: nucleoside triphosphate pyrophosphatase [Candidatus Omnitrophota bacterium]
MKRIVLASASKRRSGILTDCGIPHEIIISEYPEEHPEGANIRDIVENNAARKAESVAARVENAIVIGADTLVSHEDEVIGKPSGEDRAKELLRRFSGGRIEVYTGICVIDTISGKISRGIDKSEIFVKKITEHEIEKYFRLLGPYDKAGGFSIEGVGSIIFDDIRGSYFNILGMSMMKLSRMFENIGQDMSDYIGT